MIKIFIVILSYNTSDDTHDFLASAVKLKRDNFTIEFVVVDNASKELFVLNKSEKEMPVIVIQNNDNKGFAGGNNEGIKYALSHGADYIMIVNNDTLVDPGLVTNLFHALRKDSKVGIAVPKIYFAKGYEFHKNRYKKDDLGKVFWYAGGFTDWANVQSVHRGVDEVDHGQYDAEEEVSFASGCCMMFPASVLEKVGLFDEKYFLYFEDADINERILRMGYRVLYVPDAILWHKNAGSTGGSGSSLQDYFMTRNRMLFGMQYAPMRSKIALIRESIRLFFSGRIMQKKGIRDFYLNRFGKGTYFKV